ncbi:MAG: tail fiber domain-containing protein, partial [Elusimicrobiaceae bacterium]|nr:tail fiber domain-containing protein [Elusimicrobiaceae bacterium]
LTGQQARNNEISNNLSIFSAFNPLNGYQPGAGTPTTDIYGNAYQSQVNAYQYNQQAKQNMAKGLVDLGGSALNLAGGFLFSDARIKENLRPVGQLFNGLTIYAFNFPGEDITRIGLVAQEVEQVLPQAVKESEEGLLMVDYGLATQFEEDDEQGEE